MIGLVLKCSCSFQHCCNKGVVLVSLSMEQVLGGCHITFGVELGLEDNGVGLIMEKASELVAGHRSWHKT